MEFDLVFEGGGAKGMVFVGAMQAFEEAGHGHNRLLGTSAGAITAALLAAGYTANDMLEAMNETENDEPVFVGFMGVPGRFADEVVQSSATAELLGLVDIAWVPNWLEGKAHKKLIEGMLQIPQYRHIFSFVEQGGWFSANRFETWIRDKLNQGSFNGEPRHFGDMTLAAFFDATGSDLSLVASDTVAQQLVVLNHRTAPQCPVTAAVRMSMSIPLVWQEVEWQANWGTYRGKDVTGHSIVDGGILSNFPIELFLSAEPKVTAVMGQKHSENIIGMLIDETLDVPGAPAPEPAGGGISWSELRTVQRILRLIDTMTSARDKQVIEAFESLVVRLPAHGYGTTEFDMTDERRSALVAAGHTVTEQHLAKLGDGVAAAAQPTGVAPAAPPVVQDAAATADRIAERILD